MWNRGSLDMERYAFMLRNLFLLLCFIPMLTRAQHPEFHVQVAVCPVTEQPQLIQEIKSWLASDSQSSYRDTALEVLGTLYWGAKDWKSLDSLYSHGQYDSSEQGMIHFIHAISEAPAETFSIPQEKVKLRTGGYTRLGHLKLPCRVNGKKTKGYFDTGAGISLVSESFAKKYGVQELDSVATNALGASGIAIGLRPGIIPELAFGDLKIKNCVVGIVADEVLEFKKLGIKWVDMDLILGWTIWQELGFSYNPHNQRFELGSSELFPHSDANMSWYSIPMTSFSLSGDTTQLLAELDFGGWESNFYPAFFERYPALETGRNLDIMGGAGGYTTYENQTSDAACVTTGNKIQCLEELRSRPFFPPYRFIQPHAVWGTSIGREHGFLINAPYGWFEVR